MSWPTLQLEAWHLVTLGLFLIFFFRTVAGGAPFLPVSRREVRALLEFGKLTPDDTVYELGSGDGRFSIAAVGHAKVRRAVGYDITWPLVLLARTRAAFSGVGHRCQFFRKDARDVDVSDATFVYMYLLHKLTDELAADTLRDLRPGARVLSPSFQIDTTRHPFKLLKQQKSGYLTLYLYERI